MATPFPHGLRQNLLFSKICLALLTVAGVVPAQNELETVSGKYWNGNRIRVTVPGYFSVGVGDGADLTWSEPWDVGVMEYYDLVNDPNRRYNYACSYSGLFNHKSYAIPEVNSSVGPYHPAPGTIELIEANPVRAIIKHRYVGVNYGCIGHPDAPPQMNNYHPDLMIENLYAIYAPDKIYMTYTLVGTGNEVRLDPFQYMLHPSHVHFAGGENTTGGGYTIPAPWTFVPDNSSSFHTNILFVAKPESLVHGDGATRSLHKANFFLAMYEAGGPYGYRGNEWLGTRTSIRVEDFGMPVTDGERCEWYSVCHVNHQMTDLATALPYQTRYRTPQYFACTKGTMNGHGFDPGLGSYQVVAEPSGVEITCIADYPWPVFEISNWTGGEPMTITVGGQTKNHGTDYLAHASNGKLLLQVRGTVTGLSSIVINSGWPVGLARSMASRLPHSIRLVSRSSFEGQADIRYSLPHAADTRLSIWNSRGRLVRQLVDGRMNAGTHQVIWNGGDQHGRRVSAGAYLAQLLSEGVSRSIRVFLPR